MNLDEALDTLARDPTAPLDLAEVALRLALDEYPSLDVEAYLSELDGMAREARNYLGGGLESQVQGLCRYLFHEMGFRGNTQDYHDPRNSYLNEVLDRRTGLPITLSLVAMAVGQRAGLSVAGLGLPAHFIAQASQEGRTVLFDPFHGGRQLTEEDCEHLIAQKTGRAVPTDSLSFHPTPPGLIAIRLLTNLKGVYLRGEDFPRLVRTTERLRQLVPQDVTQRRDLGAAYLHMNQPGKAIDHLKAYLKTLPDGPDTAATRQLLAQALSLVAKWN
ncbi:MAG: transglutaminase family protein [Planctomycetia bacterium]|nr:transglutaminase family protein [Planctomycetia bacterium]